MPHTPPYRGKSVPSSRRKTVIGWKGLGSPPSRNPSPFSPVIGVVHFHSFNFSIFVNMSWVYSSALTSLLSTGHTFLLTGPFYRRQFKKCVQMNLPKSKYIKPFPRFPYTKWGRNLSHLTHFSLSSFPLFWSSRF